MPAKRILFYDGSHLGAYLWHGGQVAVEADFLPDPAGLEALGAYLQQHRTSLFHLLADVAEEGFQLEDVPYVQGRDRTAMIKRRLGQYYYGTPLSAAISLGRASGGRRDEKMLFAALTRPDAFAPWLDAIRAAGVALAGIYSVPLLLPALAKRLAGQDDGHMLLISLTRAGVRQSFFDGGKLHFSRLTQLAMRSADEIAVACAGEAAKIHQYLVGQRLIPRGTALRAVILAHPEQVATLRVHCRSTADLAFDIADLDALAQREGLKTPLTDSRAEPLFIHRLAVRAPARQFAPSAERRLYHLWQARFALASAAWVMLAGCLLFAAKTGLQLHDARQRIAEVNAQIAADTQRYDAILNGLPKIAISTDNLRTLLERYDEIAKRATPFRPVLAHLGHALAEMPRVELTRLDWALSDRIDRIDGGDKVGAGGTASPGGSGTGQGGSGAWAAIRIDGQLPLALVTDLRAQIASVDALAALLRAPGYDVVVTRMPFDVESGKPLKIRTDPAATDAPRFSLRLAKKL